MVRIKTSAIALAAFLLLAGDALAQSSQWDYLRGPNESAKARRGSQLDNLETDIEGALDIANKPDYRVRQINDIGRYGDSTLVDRIKGLVQDAEPDVRAATFRAIMRLNPDGARDELFGVLKSPNATDRDLSWAARALSRSESPDLVVPNLINLLGHKSNQVRATSMDSLRDLTGLGMGAKPKLIFPILDDKKSVQEYARDWQDWWTKNKDSSPAEWRTNALKSTEAKNIAAAARSIAQKDEKESVFALLDTFRRLRDDGTSGARDAVARAIESLTGRRLEYQAYKDREMTQEEWLEQHDSAYNEWRRFATRVFKDGDDQMLVLLEAAEPKSRLAALYSWKTRPIAEQPLVRYTDLLKDPSSAVREQAHNNLVLATGVDFPFNPAPRGNRELWHYEVQVERWRDWISQFGDIDQLGQGLVYLFQDNRDLYSLGRTALARLELKAEELKEFWSEVTEGMKRRLPSLQAKAALHIVKHRMEMVNPAPLVEVFEEQIFRCREFLTSSASSRGQMHGPLQANIAMALGILRPAGGYDLLRRRLEIAIRAREKMRIQNPAGATERGIYLSLDNPDVVYACLLGIGNLGGDAVAAASTVKRYMDPDYEESQRIRQAAVLALGMIGLEEDLKDIQRMVVTGTLIGKDDNRTIVYDRTPYATSGAIEALYFFYRRYPQHYDLIQDFLMARVIHADRQGESGANEYLFPPAIRALAIRVRDAIKDDMLAKATEKSGEGEEGAPEEEGD